MIKIETNNYRVFSMFSGIGGFDEAFRREGHTIIGHSEIDKYADQVYRRHFDNRNYGDCTRIIPEDLPDIDIICGGFPCQAFSIAGKRRGFEDTRGTLFYEIARIAKVKRPRYLLLENVKGLLNHDKGKTFGTILTALVELGYNIEWGLLNTRYFGIPQNRERVFIVASLGTGSGRKIFPIRQDGREFDQEKSELSKNIPTEETANCLTSRYYKMGKTDNYVDCIDTRKYQGETEPRIQKNICPTLCARARTDEAPCIPVLTPDRLEKRQNGRRFKEDGDPMFTLNTQDRQGIMIPRVHCTQQRGANRPSLKENKNAGGAGPLSKQDGTVYCLDTGNTQAVEIEPFRIRRLTPRECERLQGFDDGWCDGISDSQKYKCLGNALTVKVAQEIIKRLK